MCGIVGKLRFDGRPSDDEFRISEATTLLEHRGPDGVGCWEDQHIVLGHRRLSIIGLEGGSQPLSNETSDVWVTFNGEIYNYEKLRASLQTAGHRFSTTTVANSFLLLPWALYYSFAGTPVSVGDFLGGVSKPLGASLVMSAALLLLQYFAPMDNALLSLLAGCGTALFVYLLALNSLPSGRAQLRSLASELAAALRRRSSVGSEDGRDAT